MEMLLYVLDTNASGWSLAFLQVSITFGIYFKEDILKYRFSSFLFMTCMSY